MNKFYPLGKYLKQSQKLRETLTFQQITFIIGANLPPSASKYSAWWTNNPNRHPQAKEWLNAGWKVKNINLGINVTFSKIT